MLSFFRARAVPPSPTSPLRAWSWSDRVLRMKFDAALAGAAIAIDLDGTFFASTRADDSGHAQFAFAFSPSGESTAAVMPRRDRDGVPLAPEPLAIRFEFQPVDEGKEFAPRIHFDLTPLDTTRDAEVERLQELGATVVADRRRENGSGYVTMSDVDGNEFCVQRSPEEVAAAGH